MVNKYVKRHFVSTDIRDIGNSHIKKIVETECCCSLFLFSYTAGGSVNWYSYFGKLSVSNKTKCFHAL